MPISEHLLLHYVHLTDPIHRYEAVMFARMPMCIYKKQLWPVACVEQDKF